MAYILFVVILSSLIFVVFKLFDRYKVDTFQAITINYLVASFFGILIVGAEFNINLISQKPWLWHAVFIGFMFILTFVLFALSSQKAGVAITAVFSKMSVVLPVIAGIFLYSETLNWLKILGIISTMGAFILIFYKKDKSKIKWAVIILPILIFFGNGIVDTSLKFIEHHYISGDYNLFLTMIFVTALILGILISLFKYLKLKKPFTLHTIIGGTVLGLINYTTTYFMLKAMAVFQSNVLFPIQNVGIVMMSALFGLVLFREKLSLINWIGIFVSIMAILLIAFA